MTLRKALSELTQGSSITLKDCRDVPHKSGLYLIREGKKIIYVGKARKLGKRLGQHLSFNPRNSMFAYRYMLDSLGLPEPQYSAKEKNKRRQEFKQTYSSKRQELVPKIAKLSVRVTRVSEKQLHSIEREVILSLKPKLNRIKE